MTNPLVSDPYFGQEAVEALSEKIIQIVEQPGLSLKTKLAMADAINDLIQAEVIAAVNSYEQYRRASQQ